MSKQDPSEQVRFLVSCIGHTTNGRPDFAAVAGELGIVSKAAAQKRYERMLKANNVGSPKVKGEGDDKQQPETPTKKRKTAAKENGSAKKKTVRGRAVKVDEAVKKEEEGEKKPKKEETDGSDLSDAPASPSPGF